MRRAGVRKVPFTRELYIDADDFAEVTRLRSSSA